MPVPGEHKTVQARILAYAQEIGWNYVQRAEAEARRGFDPDGATPEGRARTASLYFGDLLHAQVRAFNPKSPATATSSPTCATRGSSSAPRRTGSWT
jgi:type I restriction enzyme R subunit